MAFSYEIEIKDKQLRAMLEKKLARLDDLSGFYADVGEHLLNTTLDRFETETAPDGSKWPDLSPITIAARNKSGTGSTKLRASAHLVGSINYRSSSEDARIGSPVVYAAIQLKSLNDNILAYHRRTNWQSLKSERNIYQSK